MSVTLTKIIDGNTAIRDILANEQTVKWPRCKQTNRLGYSYNLLPSTGRKSAGMARDTGSAVKQPPHDHIAAGEFSTCAHYNKRIDAGDVEQFLGLLRDVNVDVGVMISPEGYMILPRPPHECAMTGR